MNKMKKSFSKNLITATECLTHNSYFIFKDVSIILKNKCIRKCGHNQVSSSLSCHLCVVQGIEMHYCTLQGTPHYCRTEKENRNRNFQGNIHLNISLIAFPLQLLFSFKQLHHRDSNSGAVRKCTYSITQHCATITHHVTC